MPASQPLIITVSMDHASLAHFTQLRNTHFPAWCNYLDAHITLFHRLPPGIPLVEETVARLSRRMPFSLGISGIKNMGNGVAFAIDSEEIRELHAAMQRVLYAYLTAQDRKKIWPHITIQNKVTAWKAQQLAEYLSKDFKPFSIGATGLSLWKYNNGPWTHVRDFPFVQ